MLVLLIVALHLSSGRRCREGAPTSSAQCPGGPLSGVTSIGTSPPALHPQTLLATSGILLASEFKAGVSSRALGYSSTTQVVLSGWGQHRRRFGSVLGMFVGAIILSVVTTAATGLLLSPDWQFTLKAIVTFIAILAQRYALDKRNG
jgi:hypothetical protein